MIPKNLHLSNTTKLLRLKFPTYFHFLKQTSCKKKEKKGNERKGKENLNLNKRPTTYDISKTL